MDLQQTQFDTLFELAGGTIDPMDASKAEMEKDLFKDVCRCRYCGDQVKCEHGSDESHNHSMCGNCAN